MLDAGSWVVKGSRRDVGDGDFVLIMATRKNRDGTKAMDGTKVEKTDSGSGVVSDCARGLSSPLLRRHCDSGRSLVQTS